MLQIFPDIKLIQKKWYFTICVLAEQKEVTTFDVKVFVDFFQRTAEQHTLPFEGSFLFHNLFIMFFQILHNRCIFC